MSPKPLDEVVEVRKTRAGVELHVTGEGGRFVLALDAIAALALADDLTRACERPLQAVAA